MSQKGRLAERVMAASKAARLARASRMGIIASALLTFMIFSVSFYGQIVGNFTFTVDRLALDAGLSIYEDPEEQNFVTRIVAGKVDNADGMTAYCGTQYTQFPVGSEVCLPSDEEIASVNGENNGLNYLAHTFYLKHVGRLPVDLKATVKLISASKGAEEAVRVRIIIDGSGTTYAKRQSSTGLKPGELEPLTEAFYSITTVTENTFYEYQPQQIMKITVILWFEGEDSNHNIELHSGGVKFEMKFTVTKIYNEK
jgi:hypothetical protein